MTLLVMESFGHLPDGDITTTELESNVFSGVSGGLHITDLTGGQKYIKSRNSPSLGNVPILLEGDHTTLYVHFRLHALSNPGTWGEGLFNIQDDASVMGFITRDTSNRVNYRRGANLLSTVVATSSGATAVGTDDYWVVKIVFDDVAGEVHFYKNGVLDSSTTGVDTINAGTQADRLNMFGAGGGLGVYGLTGISNMVIDSATNHGEVQVLYRPVDADGSSLDWTPTGAANNWDCVDEIPPNEDTDYNRSTSTGDLDQLEQTGMDGETGTVIAVQAHARARKEDANSGKIKVGLLYSGNHSQSGELALDTAYQNFSSLFETAPGGGAWTPGIFDATEVSYQNSV